MTVKKNTDDNERLGEGERRGRKGGKMGHIQRDAKCYEARKQQNTRRIFNIRKKCKSKEKEKRRGNKENKNAFNIHEVKKRRTRGLTLGKIRLSKENKNTKSLSRISRSISITCPSLTLIRLPSIQREKKIISRAKNNTK